MTTNTEAVPLLSAEMLDGCVDELAQYLDPEESNVGLVTALQAIASGAAIVIPATERVDVERVRAVIAELRAWSDDAEFELPGTLADRLTAAIGDKTC